MIANGFEPSDSHLGGSLSWMPLYHTEGHKYDILDTADLDSQKNALSKAIVAANDKWADCVTKWMTAGAAALSKAALETKHAASLQSLNNLLEKRERYTCCNLLLDALTLHGKDVERVLATFGKPSADKPNIPKEGFKWLWAPPDPKFVANYENPYTEAEIKEFTDLAALDLPKKKAEAKVG
jgi:hypothetical protein